MKCKLMLIDKTRIMKINGLWQKLNQTHLKDSHYFKDHFKTFTFEQRCEKFMKIDNSNIRIEILAKRSCFPWPRDTNRYTDFILE